MKPFLITVFLLLTSFLPARRASYPTPAARKGPLRAALVPLGKVADTDLGVVRRALQEYYQVQVTVLAPLTVPGDARVNGSTQSVWVQAGQPRVVADTGILQANRLLTFLAGRRPKGFDKVVGVTPRGIRAGRERWTIRGMADDSCAVV